MLTKYLDKFSLSGKTAFVTGACGLLGREICTALATADAKIILLDINEQVGSQLEKAYQDAGQDVHFRIFDVTRLKTLDSQCSELLEEFKKIDIWINSAYPRTFSNRSDVNEDMDNMTLESLQENIQIHLSSTAWLCKTVGQMMKKQKCGSIINISSIYGVVGNDFSIYEGSDMTTPMYYPAVKGGLNSLTKYLASYFGAYNIRINSVCPGGVLDNQSPKFVELYSKQTPLKRMANPDEIAAPVLFLASEAASYITGAIIMVDGGWTAI